MANNLVVVINNLQVPKIKKLLLYEMKFLVPNYRCLQNPWLGGYRPQIPFLSVLCHQLNLLNPPPPPNKIPGYATAHRHHLKCVGAWRSLDARTACRCLFRRRRVLASKGAERIGLFHATTSPPPTTTGCGDLRRDAASDATSTDSPQPTPRGAPWWRNPLSGVPGKTTRFVAAPCRLEAWCSSSARCISLHATAEGTLPRQHRLVILQ